MHIELINRMINYSKSQVSFSVLTFALVCGVGASGCGYVASGMLGPSASTTPSTAPAAGPGRGIPLHQADTAPVVPPVPGSHNFDAVGPEQLTLTLDAPTALPGVKKSKYGYIVQLPNKAQVVIAVQLPNTTFQDELATASLEGNVLASSEFERGWEIDFTAGKSRVKRIYKNFGATYVSCEITSKGSYNASAAVANHDLCMSLRQL
jgi:hypothetical protein